MRDGCAFVAAFDCCDCAAGHVLTPLVVLLYGVVSDVLYGDWMGVVHSDSLQYMASMRLYCVCFRCVCDTV